MGENHKQVTVDPQAFVSMLLHSRQHPHQAVHGLLLGKAGAAAGTLSISAAVPVCHGAPVQPWIETSLSLVEAQLEGGTKIVGWYTAPMLLQDARPGPAALRMASILESASNGDILPTLVVLKNEHVAECFKGDDANKVDSAIQAFGKDFGNQFQEEIPTLVTNSAKVLKALNEAVESKIGCNDFLDHLEGDSPTAWYPNKELSKIVEKLAS